jgi:ATP-dependent Clp protease adaptor protein ClpS
MVEERTKIVRLAHAFAPKRLHNAHGMTTTHPRKEKRSRTGSTTKPDLPWNVILHNDWENSMPRVVIVLKQVIPGMTLKKATKIMYEAHKNGQAVVKSCHKELAELYEQRLLAKGLTASIETSS